MYVVTCLLSRFHIVITIFSVNLFFFTDPHRHHELNEGEVFKIFSFNLLLKNQRGLDYYCQSLKVRFLSLW